VSGLLMNSESDVWIGLEQNITDTADNE